LNSSRINLLRAGLQIVTSWLSLYFSYNKKIQQ
jgi:hypothetical protein